jgi:hypothetical protein
MDSQGFVPLNLITTFKMMQNFTNDLDQLKDLIKLSAQQSYHVEVRTGDDGIDRIRRRHDWGKFILEVDKRSPDAQHSGPKSFQSTAFSYTQLDAAPYPHPPQPSSHIYPASAGPTAPGLNGNTYYAVESANGEAMMFQEPSRQIASPHALHAISIASQSQSGSPMISAGFQPNGVLNPEADAYSDAEVERLNIMTRMPGSAPFSPLSMSSQALPPNGLTDGGFGDGQESLNGKLTASASNGTGAANV